MTPEFRTVTILYTEECKAWCNYLLPKFKSDKLKLKLDTLCLTSLDYEKPPEIQAAVTESYVVMLLVSYDFLEYMGKNRSWFAPMLQSRDKNITTIVTTRLNTSADDLEKVLCEGYSGDKQWEKLEIDVQGKNTLDIISHILGIVDKNSDTCKRLLRTTSAPDLSDSLEKESVEMIPRRVNEVGEKVALVFSKEKREGSVSVQIEGKKVPVKFVNPYCVTFQAPEIKGPKIHLQVLVDNNSRSFRLYGRKAPEFSSVELMRQSYGLASKDDLDKYLAEKFSSSLCADEQAMTVFSVIPKNISKGCLYPTLLHWAAANGLKELCSTMLTAPGANEACSILNCDGDDVSSLAYNNKYEELSDFITETEEILHVRDLYVQVARSSSTSDDDLYVDMSDGANGMQKSPKPPPKPSLPPKDFLPPCIKSPSECDSRSNLSAPNKPLLTAKEFWAAKVTPVLPLGATGSKSQSELIEIQEEVKKGTFTIKEAELLFNAWKARYETGNAISFKERQQNLQVLRDKHKEALEVVKATYAKKGKGGKKTDDLKSNFPTISDPVGMRKKSTPFSPSIKGSNDTMPFSSSVRANIGSGISAGSHDSGRFSGRVSGRDSTLSNTSTSSEELEMDEERKLLRGDRSQSERNTGRSNNYRKSTRELYLELTYDLSDLPDNPPPLPPRERMPAQTDVKEQAPPVSARPTIKYVKK